MYRDRRSIEARESEGQSGPPVPARAGEAAQYQKLSDETVGLGSETKTLETAPDAHTKENHKKRKTLQTRRDDLAKAMETIAANANEGQKAMQQLYERGEQPSPRKTCPGVDVEGRAIQGIGSTPPSALPSKNHHARFTVESSENSH